MAPSLRKHMLWELRLTVASPVRTFDTAAVYYHKFRFRYPSSEYDFSDVALASLFVACKTEDTIKKSREILCAAHNLRHPNDHKTPDDKVCHGPTLFRAPANIPVPGFRVPVERHRRLGTAHSRDHRLRLSCPIPAENPCQNGPKNVFGRQQRHP